MKKKLGGFEMTKEEKEIALYCLKASSDYHSEVCEECVKYPNCDHTIQDDVTETIIKALEQQPSEDCVSRQAVLDILSHYAHNFGADNEIKALPPVTPTQRWIPVSEKLPEEGKEVLVYYKYFRYGDYNCMYPTYSVGFQYDGIWGGDVRGHKLNVIAWQPLPKPYEEKRGSEDGSN